jgi:uncharacterized membrane protein
MESIHYLLTTVAKIIDIIGVIILLYGFIKILIKYLLVEFKNINKTSIILLQSVRCELGIYILLALDFLIASDIIHTVTELSQRQLIELSVMIVLRTAIGYFLGKEVEEIKKSEAT